MQFNYYALKVPAGVTAEEVRYFLKNNVAPSCDVMPIYKACDRCNGTGKNQNFGKVDSWWGPQCYTCHGHGTIQTEWEDTLNPR